MGTEMRGNRWRVADTMYWFRFFLWWLSCAPEGYSSSECIEEAAGNHVNMLDGEFS